MGNRAVIAFQEERLTMIASDTVGIYLHWNGGPESVTAFLDAAKELGVRSENEYGAARLCQIIGNWFGGTLSIGIGTCRTMDTDNGDNGTYVVDLKNHGWDIQKQFDGYDLWTDWNQSETNRVRRDGILAEVLEANRPIFQPEKVTA